MATVSSKYAPAGPGDAAGRGRVGQSGDRSVSPGTSTATSADARPRQRPRRAQIRSIRTVLTGRERRCGTRMGSSGGTDGLLWERR